ncbi:MAG: bL21 family ribosomal protein, partial [Gemmatimonadetes bacterium]|nr:bL21 family ribosomal protein [Gemmatimonadota bacterium]
DHQIRLQEGESLLLDYNESWEPGSEVVLDQVCVLGGPAPKIGSPYVDGAKVVLEVQGVLEAGASAAAHGDAETVIFVDALPMGGTGKIQKTKLREEYGGG